MSPLTMRAANSHPRLTGVLGSLSFTFPGTAGSNFVGKIFVERFRFIFSFLCRKNNRALQF